MNEQRDSAEKKGRSAVVADAAKIVTPTAAEAEKTIEKPETSQEIMLAIVSILQSKKARDIVSIAVDHLTVVADYFVIASGTSTTAVKALAEYVDEKMSGLGLPPVRADGLREGKWVALDFGSVIVHVFHAETRNIYQLEKLWTDGTNVTAYLDE